MAGLVKSALGAGYFRAVTETRHHDIGATEVYLHGWRSKADADAAAAPVPGAAVSYQITHADLGKPIDQATLDDVHTAVKAVADRTLNDGGVPDPLADATVDP